jgi:ribonuclease D
LEFSNIPQVIGGEQGFHIESEDQLNYAFSDALSQRNTYSVLDVRLERNDKSPALDRLTKNLAKRFYHHHDPLKRVYPLLRDWKLANSYT